MSEGGYPESLPQALIVRALYDFSSSDSSSLSFKRGTLIEVLTQLDSGWWDGLVGDDRGWFPSNYVEKISDEELERELLACEAEANREHSSTDFAKGNGSHHLRPASGMAQNQSRSHESSPRFHDAQTDPMMGSGLLGTSDSFASLGLGQGFDSLHALIKGQGLANSDAFEQLAEAAMLDPSRGTYRDLDPGSDPEDVQAPTRVGLPGGIGGAAGDSRARAGSGRLSEASSHAGSISASPSLRSLSELGGSAPTVKNERAGLARQASPHLSLSDRERTRAHTVSSGPSIGGGSSNGGGFSLSPLSRPRASTGLQAEPRMVSKNTSSSANLTSKGTTEKRGEGDFWVPKATDRGEIVYYNTQTGATSYDLPEGLGDDSGDEEGQPPSSEDESLGASVAARHQMNPPENQLRRGSTATNASSRPSTGNSGGTATNTTAIPSLGRKVPPRNAVGLMPKSFRVPWPWVIRLTEDEQAFFFYNRQSKEARWDSPPGVDLASPSAVDRDQDRSRASSADYSASNLAMDSEESDVDGFMNPRMPGKSARKRLAAAAANRSGGGGGSGAETSKAGSRDGRRLASTHAQLDIAPRTMTDDEALSRELQKRLEPAPPSAISYLADQAMEALARLIDIASEPIASDGQSEADRLAARSSVDPTFRDSRLSFAASSVVSSVCELLYACGSLSISAVDLCQANELAASAHDFRGPEDELLSAFVDALRDLTAKPSLDMHQLEAWGLPCGSHLSTPPASIHPPGRRVNTLISKLVLSSRQAIDHTAAMSTRSNEPSQDDENVSDLKMLHYEKIVQYRHRVREDCLELGRTISVLATEAERSRSTAIQAAPGLSHPVSTSSTMPMAWVRRFFGVIQSGAGSSGVGPESLGGGSSSGWRGGGFVLPTTIEASALRAEAIGNYNNPFELTKEARSALLRGKASIRRRPTRSLSLEDVESGLKPHLDDFVKQVDELLLSCKLADSEAESPGKAADPGREPVGEGPAQASGTHSSAATTPGSSRSPSSMSTSTLHASVSKARPLLARIGTLLELVDGIDLASALDVDGPEGFDADGSAFALAYAASSAQAKDEVKRFNLLRQGTYDWSSKLLMESQNATAAAPPIVEIAADPMASVAPLAQSCSNLKAVAQQMMESLLALARLSASQLEKNYPRIGARAHVYGVEEVPAGLLTTSQAPTSASVSLRKASLASVSIQDEVENHVSSGSGRGEGSDGEVMYLGPGIAVPNGPRSRHKSSTASSVRRPSAAATSPTSTSSQAHSSILIQGRGGLGSLVSRQRSTSVTTGGSNKSSSSFLGRRVTTAESHSHGNSTTPAGQQHQAAAAEGEDEGSIKSPQSAKVRRLLGDDAPSQENESSSMNPHVATSSAASNASTTVLGSLSSRKQEETPWFLEPDYAPGDIVMSQEGQVKGATLGALMERLTMHNSFDSSFNNTFLMTYRSFTTTEEFLDLLFARYRIQPPPGLTAEELELWTERKQKPIRLRVFNVLKSWLEGHFYEGEDDPYLSKVTNFALNEMALSAAMKNPSQQLIRLVERKHGEGEQSVRKMVMPTSAPPPILPKNLKKIKFLEIDPLEMARQLTLLESKLYNKVKPVECLGLKWTKPGNEVNAKGIMDAINTHNRISAWVAEAILQQEDLKKRSALIKHFIAIADRCRALNNFSGMWAIVSALSTAPIHRLKRTWDAVNQKHVLVFESLEQLMSASKNWSNYREMIHKLNPPCVPFLGRYLGDLTFIEDGNRDRLKTDERLINFGKRQKTAEVIREITIHQSTPYNLTPVPGIQRFIDDNLVESRGADELYEQSLLLEPREREDEKIARLLQESGFL